MSSTYRTRSLAIVVATAACFGLLVPTTPAGASSSAVATGDSTVDHRPVAWKNRDHWSTPDGWKVIPYHYAGDNSSFGSGDRYRARFNYSAASALGSSGRDQITEIQVPWAGINDRGLGLVQVDGATLKAEFAEGHGFLRSQVANGITQGFLNHIILSRAEHVDDVENILRDTNNGGGFNSSTARNTATIVTVFDRWGNSATFEIDGNSFARDNVDRTYVQDDVSGTFADPHNDDKDLPSPGNGTYNGYDWRTNYTKVRHKKPNGFPYYVDVAKTGVDPATKKITNFNSGGMPDGVHDWLTSTSALNRQTRVGIRMDDPHLKDYRFFIQKNVGRRGLPNDWYMESLAKNVGELPSETIATQKSTGWHVNRFVSTFGVVVTGAKIGDPYDGKLSTMWVALGEPTVSVFVPLFPYAGPPPQTLNDMYVHSNQKRHQVYDYNDDASCGYSCGRNVDHSINLVALAGDPAAGAGYYGEGGIQRYTFAIENWAFAEYDRLMGELRSGSLSDSALKQRLAQWQDSTANFMKIHYVNGTTP